MQLNYTINTFSKKWSFSTVITVTVIRDVICSYYLSLCIFLCGFVIPFVCLNLFCCLCNWPDGCSALNVNNNNKVNSIISITTIIIIIINFVIKSYIFH